MHTVHYLDNSATTKPCKEAVDALNRCLLENWGNPSSLYILGMNAEDEITEAKRTVSKKLACREDEIFFTSGGTEANNLLLQGAALSRIKRGKRIVTTAFEHPSVSETLSSLKDKGFEIITLTPDKQGNITHEEMDKAITADTVLVSIMLVNNEIGSVQDVAYAAEVIKRVGAPALLHTDAVQAFGKIDIKPSALGVDLLTASGHKIHAPKGIGFAFIKKGVHITPTVFGGGQQNGLRPGTEPVPLIASLSAAVKALPNTKDALLKMQELRDYAIERLKTIDCAVINSSESALPYLLNFSLCGYRSETVLHFLEMKQIYVSSGSACAKGALSPTLTSMGLSRDRIDSAIRISFSRLNEKEDVDALCEALKDALAKLKRSK